MTPDQVREVSETIRAALSFDGERRLFSIIVGKIDGTKLVELQAWSNAPAELAQQMFDLGQRVAQRDPGASILMRKPT